MNTLIRIMKRMRSEVEMLEHLKEEVFQANLELPKQGSIKYTWGNVSAFDKETGYLSSNQAA